MNHIKQSKINEKCNIKAKIIIDELIIYLKEKILYLIEQLVLQLKKTINNIKNQNLVSSK